MKTFLRLSRTGKKHPTGCEVLKLTRCWFGGDWSELDSVECISGVPSRQKFRIGRESEPGSLEPIPEGYYFLGKPEWKGAAGDWSQSYGNGLGPIWVDIKKVDKTQTDRDAFGIHYDANMDVNPGSAGCVVFQDKNALRKCLSWWDNLEQKPYILTANWGLGTVETSDKAVTQKPKVAKPDPIEPKPNEPKPVPKPNEPKPEPGAKGKAIVFGVVGAVILLGGLIAYFAITG